MGGEVIRTPGAYDFAPNKFLYALYSDAMPRVLNLLRARGRRRTKQAGADFRARNARERRSF
ncbi:MAG: hypothetical protein DPW15_17180 [Chloroflexi bacterium]|nr:hypothetical protein [Chloroflexota bacterium]